MIIQQVISVRLVPRLYLDIKTGQECFGTFVLIEFVANNRVYSSCSAVLGVSQDTDHNRAYEKAAFLGRMAKC